MRILLWVLAPSFFFDRGIFDGSKSGGMYLFNTLRSPIFSRRGWRRRRGSEGLAGGGDDRNQVEISEREGQGSARAQPSGPVEQPGESTRRALRRDGERSELARKDRARASCHPD